MKNRLYLALVLLLAISLQAVSQQKCTTSERMKQVFENDPAAQARYEQTQKMLAEKAKQANDANFKLFQVSSITYIPVVVHVMYGNPNQVTDAIIQRQLDTLNKYYGGAPLGDSLRVYEPFRSSYGRSQIRFCLAQKTPTNQLTTGITRTTSSFNPNGFAHPSAVVPAWNTNKYLNIWVVDFGTSGTLGYSYLPGTFAPGDQRAGFVVDYRCFGSNATYLYSTFNQGKTAVHEIGHFFNLEHTWGPGNANSSCIADDGCTDTPKTDGPYFGCATFGPITNSCAPTGPGIMWQNMMDYADDRCMLLFTAQQCARMENALNNAPDRSGLKTSDGCQPPISAANDAGISAILNPVNGRSFCTPGITPQVTLTNTGSNTLTSVQILVSLNGQPQAPFNWTGSLATNASITVNLPALNLSTGNNAIVITTSMPNGVADANPGNDSQSAAVTYTPTIPLPIIEGFESTTFPPPGWFIRNPNNDFTWQRVTPGRASLGAMYINNFDDDAENAIDDFRSLNIQTNGAQALLLNFDLAHKNYPTTGFHDTLSVLVSGDCGNTFQTVYKKWGSTLATAGSSSNAYTSPQPADWRTENISITGPVLASGNLVVVFRNTSRFGNNIFIDNINLLTPAPRDLQLLAINSPVNLNCGTTISPQIVVRNQSQETVTSFKVGYQLDNGTISTVTINQSINPLESATVNLNALPVAAGNHIIKLFTADPVSASGTGDANTLNDTLSRTFAVPGSIAAPITESFITAAFPPANWTSVNPDNGIGWTRHNNGNGNAGSAYINNFNYLATGQRDLLVMPLITYTGVDSVKLHFDLAAASNRAPGNPMDTLEVLVSTDCGNNFTTVYKKWGAELRTISNPPATQFFPANAAQWRKEIVDLSAYAGTSPIMVAFRSINNNENNIFIDNINLNTITLPGLLKQRGYLVYPNVFESNFTIWHYQQPTNLKFINIYTMTGQLIWSRLFSGNADRVMNMDLNGKPAGMYIIRMGYDGRDDIIEKIIKR